MRIGSQVPANIKKQFFLVMTNLCLRGKKTATALSIVSGSRANKPDFPKLYTEIVYATQYRVVLLFGAPTNLLSIIPSPLKNPKTDNRTSLTATLMIRRLLQLGSLLLLRARKNITEPLKKTPRIPIAASIEP